MKDVFAVYIEPTAPVILGRRLNLDAILAHLLLEQLRAAGVPEDEALRRAHTEIPLQRVAGVFAGSSALISKTKIHKRTVYGSLQRHVAAIPDFDTVLLKNQHTSANSRDFERIEKVYTTFVTYFHEFDLHKPNMWYEDDRDGGIWFVGHGDRAVVESLMKNGLRYIGAKRTPIKTPQFFDAQPSRIPGLLGHGDEVLRPVPCDIDLGSTVKASRSYERFCPPYWRSALARDPVLCHVPPQAMWPSSGEIKEMIGI